MKFTIAYYLVLLYLAVLLKPLILIIGDVWAHQFDGIEHVSLIHAKYGNSHLQKDLTDEKEGKNQSTSKSASDVPFHITAQPYRYNFSIPFHNIQFVVLKLHQLPLVLIFNEGPPPKFS